jgi:hypothetical protein
MAEYQVETVGTSTLPITADGFTISDGHLLLHTGSVSDRKSVAAFAPGKWLSVKSNATQQPATKAG